MDVQFLDGGLKLFGKEESYDKIVDEIESVDGILEHGLVVGVATKAVIGTLLAAGEEEVESSEASSSGPRVVQL